MPALILSEVYYCNNINNLQFAHINFFTKLASEHMVTQGENV